VSRSWRWAAPRPAGAQRAQELVEARVCVRANACPSNRWSTSGVGAFEGEAGVVQRAPFSGTSRLGERLKSASIFARLSW
jgi:hypothetical protein